MTSLVKVLYNQILIGPAGVPYVNTTAGSIKLVVTGTGPYGTPMITYTDHAGSGPVITGLSQTTPAGNLLAFFDADAPDFDGYVGSVLLFSQQPVGEVDGNVVALVNALAATIAALTARVAVLESGTPIVTPPVVPAAPTNVTASAGNAQASVTWTAPTTGTPTSYVVTASPGGQSVTVAGTATTAQVTGLVNGTAYTFSVIAVSGSRSGPAGSTPSSVTPSAPTASAVLPSTALYPSPALYPHN